MKIIIIADKAYNISNQDYNTLDKMRENGDRNQSVDCPIQCQIREDYNDFLVTISEKYKPKLEIDTIVQFY